MDADLKVGPTKTLAEVCRNRTDRSTVGRPAGFEVPDGHQPACTSAIIIAYLVPGARPEQAGSWV